MQIRSDIEAPFEKQKSWGETILLETEKLKPF